MLNTRKQMLKIRKDLIKLNQLSKRLKFETIKLRFRLKEVSIFVLAGAYTTIILLPIYSNLTWIVAFIKGTPALMVSGAAASAGAVAATTIITVNGVTGDKYEPNEAESALDITTITTEINENEIYLQNTEPVNTPQIKESSVPKFKPKIGTVTKIDGSKIIGIVSVYTSSYIIISIDGSNKKIKQEDIYNIEW